MQVFPYPKWNAELPRLAAAYRSADPFPHAVLEEFLNGEAAQAAASSFPPLGPDDWINYTHVNERKFGLSDMSRFPAPLRNVITGLNSAEFVLFLSKLTGIEELLADDSLEGGGLHLSPRGGYLNVHADFTVHPHRPDWRRRVNVLVYFNAGWKEEYGGNLELWDRRMKQCRQRILPLFNRAVIFNTDEDSFHGHPSPNACPAGMARRSIALYYFTRDQHARVRSTEYRARPGDGFLKRMMISADKMVLKGYDAVKRKLGLSDRLASTVLRWMRRR